jgi:hypothetical protein
MRRRDYEHTRMQVEGGESAFLRMGVQLGVYAGQETRWWSSSVVLAQLEKFEVPSQSSASTQRSPNYAPAR